MEESNSAPCEGYCCQICRHIEKEGKFEDVGGNK